MEVKIGGDAEKLAIKKFVSDNAHEAISENCPSVLDKSESIEKKETTRKMYEKCA